MTPGERLAAAARRFEGVRFRLHGRDPATGLDCIGLLHAGLAGAGRNPSFPNGYRLRSRAVTGLEAVARANGFATASGDPLVGDVLFLSIGCCQHHLMIAVASCDFIHAHAGIGRVVIHRGDLPGVIAGHWRLPPTTPGS